MRQCSIAKTQSQIGNRKPKKGFTIVELLMVIGIISVLITITVSAISGSMKRARSQKASALCKLVEQGINTYYAQDPDNNGEWPVEPKDSQGGSDVYVYTASEVREMIRKVVEQTRKGNPMMDVSGLFVSKTSGESGTRGYGTDFLTALRGTKKNPEGISLNQMYFGYPDPTTGYFRRFRITYSPSTDSVSVSTL